MKDFLPERISGTLTLTAADGSSCVVDIEDLRLAPQWSEGDQDRHIVPPFEIDVQRHEYEWAFSSAREHRRAIGGAAKSMTIRLSLSPENDGLFKATYTTRSVQQ